jgi:chromosome segregation ATPase
MLQLTYSMAEFPVSPDTLRGLLRSPAVLDAAAAELGLSAEEVRSVSVELDKPSNYARPDRLSSLGAVLRITLQTARPDAQKCAARLASDMCKRLGAVLAASSEPERQRLQERLEATRRARADAERRLREIHARQEQLCATAGQVTLSREAVLDMLRTAESSVRDLELRLVGLHARQDALVEQIARIGSETDKKADEDPAVAELAKIVGLRETKLQRVLDIVKKAQATEVETADAEEAVAMARAELARQRQAVAQAAGLNLLDDLRKELFTLSAGIAEAEAERALLRARLAEAQEKKLLELADQYEREVELPLASARNALHEATKQVEEMEQQAGAYRPPSLTVLGVE